MEPSVKGRERIFHIDLFLLCYLRDTLKALKLIQIQLSSIDCTIQLNVEEEELVVRDECEGGSRGDYGAAADSWQAKVDRVIDGFKESYLCYHVLEPEKEKLIMQDPSFVTDAIKVYSYDGYPVVVGETEIVKRKIALLEMGMPNRKECPVLEKQFNLVEEMFRQEMQRLSPQVKILRTRPDMITLEGPDKEVESGSTKLNELIKIVKEKRVKLSTAMQYFITASGAISKYENNFWQCFKKPVSLMLDSDLVLLSLSSDVLDEAIKIMYRDLSVVTVDLLGAAAIPPDLDRIKEILHETKNKANATELRVDLRYTTGPTGTAKTEVHLVGYSENVNQLKDLLHDYQMNHVEAQEVLNLPIPQMVDHFDKILAWTGMKQPKVMLKPSHSPDPCVLISGPRCLVQETHQALKAALTTVTSDTLVLDGPWAQQYFQEEGKISKEGVEHKYQVLIIGKEGAYSPRMQTASNVTTSTIKRSMSCGKERPREVIRRNKSFSRSFSRSSTTANVMDETVNNINLDIKCANLLEEKVDVIVVPMLKNNLSATQLGSTLLRKIVERKKAKFKKMAKKCGLSPGDILQLDDPIPLPCSCIFFIECLPWDGDGGQSALKLGEGLMKCLECCRDQGRTSVAFPIIGAGATLGYPTEKAIHVLIETITQFKTSAASGFLSTICVVIYPSSSTSEACYLEVYRQANLYQQGQEIYKSLACDLDELTVIVGGGVKLQLVQGDIAKETTDAVVNTTNFINFNTSTCKAVLAKAGPEVEAALKTAQVDAGGLFVTQPGNFPCKVIFHVNGNGNEETIEQLVGDIITRCERAKLKSVAIPAICVGPGNLRPEAVAGAIFRAVHTSTSCVLFRYLSTIRIVLFETNVFLTFKQKVIQRFPSAAMTAVSMLHAPQHQHPCSRTQHQNVLHTDSSIKQSIFQVVGLSQTNVEHAMAKMKQLYQTQCTTVTIGKEDLAGFTDHDMKSLMDTMSTEGLDYTKDESEGVLKITGKKDNINTLRMRIIARAKSHFRKEVRLRDEYNLCSQVSWCIMGSSDNWERLPMKANYDLEINGAMGGITDAQGTQWTVDPERTRAQTDGQTRQLKRLKNLQELAVLNRFAQYDGATNTNATSPPDHSKKFNSDFIFPLHWDNMTADEKVKVVQLHSTSAEYKTVKSEFRKTAANPIKKIERVQNIHLRRAYEVQKRRISDNNRQLGQDIERTLYHGTTEDCCKSIIKTGFNRGYCGQNGTVFGFGTYFAVDASYSTNPTYSKPAADGSRFMLVAKVLTGSYTVGHKAIKVPPARNAQQPHDLYDSVVNDLNKPTMFVVFHDDQAYPDYLITFK